MERMSIMQVYKLCLDNGRELREVAKRYKTEDPREAEVSENRAQVYYKIASWLEQTPEINP
jgi:hypothetical protein